MTRISTVRLSPTTHTNRKLHPNVSLNKHVRRPRRHVNHQSTTLSRQLRIHSTLRQKRRHRRHNRRQSRLTNLRTPNRNLMTHRPSSSHRNRHNSPLRRHQANHLNRLGLSLRPTITLSSHPRTNHLTINNTIRLSRLLTNSTLLTSTNRILRQILSTNISPPMTTTSRHSSTSSRQTRSRRHRHSLSTLRRRRNRRHSRNRHINSSRLRHIKNHLHSLIQRPNRPLRSNKVQLTIRPTQKRRRRPHRRLLTRHNSSTTPSPNRPMVNNRNHSPTRHRRHRSHSQRPRHNRQILNSRDLISRQLRRPHRRPNHNNLRHRTRSHRSHRRPMKASMARRPTMSHNQISPLDPNNKNIRNSIHILNQSRNHSTSIQRTRLTRDVRHNRRILILNTHIHTRRRPTLH